MVGWLIHEYVGRLISWLVGVENSREEHLKEHGEALKRAEGIEKSMEKH